MRPLIPMAEFDEFEKWENHIRNRARELKDEQGVKMGHAYEAVARESGFQTYAAMRACAKDLLQPK